VALPHDAKRVPQALGPREGYLSEAFSSPNLSAWPKRFEARLGGARRQPGGDLGEGKPRVGKEEAKKENFAPLLSITEKYQVLRFYVGRGQQGSSRFLP
jgi:hypothetical protein